MDNYNRILNEIKNDINRSNVESDENQISLYDLYNIINLKFNKLYLAISQDTVFKSKSIFPRNLCKRASFNIDTKRMIIYIETSKNTMNAFHICKDFNSEKIYFLENNESLKKIIDSFTKKHYEEIINIFSIIEEYRPLIMKLHEPLSFTSESIYYDMSICMLHLDNVDIKINLKDNINFNNYYNKEELLEILDESKFELSKKIKVDFNKLDELLKQIIIEYYENNKEKIK